jgi:hypothetical protein
MNDPRTPSRYFVRRKKVNPYAKQIANEIIEGDAYLAMVLINEEIKRRIDQNRGRRTMKQYAEAALDIEKAVFGTK